MCCSSLVLCARRFLCPRLVQRAHIYSTPIPANASISRARHENPNRRTNLEMRAGRAPIPLTAIHSQICNIHGRDPERARSKRGTTMGIQQPLPARLTGSRPLNKRALVRATATAHGGRAIGIGSFVFGAAPRLWSYCAFASHQETSCRSREQFREPTRATGRGRARHRKGKHKRNHNHNHNRRTRPRSIHAPIQYLPIWPLSNPTFPAQG